MLLDADHLRIGALLDKLVAVVRADDRVAALATWSEAEEAILRHFNLEEMFIFPALLSAHPDEIAVLEREHNEMRRILGELGVAFELHTVRCDTIENLCLRLRHHAGVERGFAYGDSSAKLEPGAARSLLARMRHFGKSHASQP